MGDVQRSLNVSQDVMWAALPATLPDPDVLRIPLRERIRHAAPIRDEGRPRTAPSKLTECLLASPPQRTEVFVNLVTNLGRGLREVFDLDKIRVGKSLPVLAHHRVHDG